MYIISYIYYKPKNDPNTSNWLNYPGDRATVIKRILEANEYQGDTTVITAWLQEYFASSEHLSEIEVMRELSKRDIHGVIPTLGDDYLA